MSGIDLVFVGSLSAVPEPTRSQVAAIVGIARTTTNPAIDALTADPDKTTIYLIAPGVYSLNAGALVLDKSMRFIGLGASPTDVVFTRGGGYSERNALVLGPNTWECVFENLSLESTNSSGDNLVISYGSTHVDCALTFRHCRLYKRWPDRVFARGESYVSDRFRVTMERCVIDSNVMLFGGWSYGGWYGESIAFDRCVVPGNASFQVVSGPLSLADYVAAPTAGYGTDGWTLPTLPIESRCVDLRESAPPRVVLFDWDFPALHGTVVPDSSGHWTAHILVGTVLRYGIYYPGSDPRCPPIIHGPYTAE